MRTVIIKKYSPKQIYYPIVKVFLLLALLAEISACNRQGSVTTESSSQKPKRIRLVVGQIREVHLPVPSDTTIQLTASSENNEIVDVTRQTTLQTKRGKKKALFLIKAITGGAVKVIFSQKGINEEGAGNILKTYQVQVVNK